ncbi:MAG: polyprenyl synthetase family protein [Myxococcaceae bacterium]|jgi:geranylgeranyl diphosphate synthase type II|nr:polyprenyl synthetase family protein [Myxococcaceae bacterium]
MPFDFSSWLGGMQTRVEALLDARMQTLAGRAPAALAEAMRYSLLGGGKRLRPLLTLAFADALSGGGPVADDAACAVECIHTYSLIHDDLPAMDDDDLRRGRPTSHKVYGEAMAILAGDALLTDAFALLATGLAGEQAVRGELVALLAVAAGAGGMVGGQVLDIAADRPAEQAYLLTLHRLKTGALIKAACGLGVLAARGPAAAREAAAQYGDALGLAFQIADDVLDVTSTPEQLGKPSNADAAAGRFTFPAVIGLDASRRLALDLAARAKEAVRVVEPTPGPLAAMADYAVERTT